MKRGSNAATFAVYLLISVAFFSPPLRNHFSTQRIGVSADPTIYIWKSILSSWNYRVLPQLSGFDQTKIVYPSLSAV
jgi:hypothetical protein